MAQGLRAGKSRGPVRHRFFLSQSRGAVFVSVRGELRLACVAKLLRQKGA
jgi:hypothetical protein